MLYFASSKRETQSLQDGSSKTIYEGGKDSEKLERHSKQIRCKDKCFVQWPSMRLESLVPRVGEGKSTPASGSSSDRGRVKLKAMAAMVQDDAKKFMALRTP